jgi:hypothetical protein
MASIGLMLCLIFYIFGVMFTQLYRDLYVEGYTDYNYFSDLDWTFLTLFQMMTMDNWASIARQVIHVYQWAWLPFTLFVIISGFIVANLIIAVICDAIGALHANEKAKLLGGDYDETNNDATATGGCEEDTNSKIMDIREQLDHLEDQLVDLTRIQARTFHTLQYLTQQIQKRKLKQEPLESSQSTGSTTASITTTTTATTTSTTNVTSPQSTVPSSLPPPETATAASSKGLSTLSPMAERTRQLEERSKGG